MHLHLRYLPGSFHVKLLVNFNYFAQKLIYISKQKTKKNILNPYLPTPLPSHLIIALFAAEKRNHFPQREIGSGPTNHRTGSRFGRLGPPRGSGWNQLQRIGPIRIRRSSDQQPSRLAAVRSSQEVVESVLRHASGWRRGYSMTCTFFTFFKCKQGNLYKNYHCKYVHQLAPKAVPF